MALSISTFRNIISLFKKNIHLMLIYRMALVLALSTLCRILFYVFNTGFYPDMTLGHFSHLLVGGIRFDILGLVYVNSIYLLGMLIPFKFRYKSLYQKIFKYLFIITNGIAILANCIDIIYFRFTLRRTTTGVFNEFKNERNLFTLFADFFVQYWFIVLIFIGLIAILILAYGKLQRPNSFPKPAIYYSLNSAYMLLGVWLMLAGARGMFTFMDRPITLSNAAEYVKDPIEMSLVQSTPSAIIKTLFRAETKVYHFFDSEEAMDAVYTPFKSYTPSSPMRKKNVVILIMESFGGEYISGYNEHTPNFRSYTPFLDSLMTHSRYYLHSYANGRKSIDAMPSILASIPSMETPYALSPYSGNQINGIASLLHKKGYHSAFFHGAPNGSMGFLAIANLLGFKKYYGMTEFNNPAFFDKTGGIFDEEFLQYFSHQMDTMPQPFCTSVFTLSSHTPFTLPERYKNTFEAPSPFFKSLLYSDNALRLFFEKASQSHWFHNTLFVIVADHGSTYSYLPEYKTSSGIFSIPIVFYAPDDSSLTGYKNQLIQQIDILPSVLSYLNYDGDFIAFGNNVFDENPDDFVVNYPGIPQLIWDDYLIHFDGEKITALYNYAKDVYLNHNIIGQYPEIEKSMQTKLEAFLQQYTSRLTQNRLTSDEGKKFRKTP